MKCPKCGGRLKTFDSRPRDGSVYRRKRCLACGYTFSTIEISMEQKSRYELIETTLNAMIKIGQKARGSEK